MATRAPGCTIGAFRINPRTGKTDGKEKAREIFDLMVDNAWKTGDPGYVVIDRINNSTSN